METQKGIIVHLSTKRGFGFIQSDSGERIFFHANGCVGTDFEDLREGMEVEFMVTIPYWTDKPRAIGVVEA